MFLFLLPQCGMKTILGSNFRKRRYLMRLQFSTIDGSGWYGMVGDTFQLLLLLLAALLRSLPLFEIRIHHDSLRGRGRRHGRSFWHGTMTFERSQKLYSTSHTTHPMIVTTAFTPPLCDVVDEVNRTTPYQ